MNSAIPTHPAMRVQILEGADWLEPVLALHAQVHAELTLTQRTYLLPRPPDYFRDLLNGKIGALAGVLIDGELAAMIALVRTDQFAKAHAEGRITYPDASGELADAYGEGGVVVAQAMAAARRFGGRGLGRMLIKAAIGWSQAQGCRHLFAQVAEQHMANWLRFLEHDFAIVAAWTSGDRRFLLRWLCPEEKAALLHTAQERHIYRKDPAQLPALVAELDAKLEQGYVAFLGQTSDYATQLILFYAKVKPFLSGRTFMSRNDYKTISRSDNNLS